MGDLNKRVHPECTNASNPYHECAVDCLEKISNGHGRKDKKFSASKSFEITNSFATRKKELETRSMPRPVESHRKPQQVVDKKPVQSAPSAAHTPIAPLAPPHNSGTEKSVQNNPPSFSFPEKHSDAVNTRDQSVDKEQDKKSSKAIPPTTNETRKDSVNRAAPTRPDDPISLTKSAGVPLALEKEDGEDDDDDEIKLVISDSRVPIGKYYVKSSAVSTLQSIFDKQGDIAARCRLKSVSILAYYLESLCGVVQELQSLSITEITNSKVEEMLDVLNDVESAKIDVSWLRDVLNELVESLEVSNVHQELEAAKVNCDSELVSVKRKLESQMEELSRKQKEIDDVEAIVVGTRSRLAELELEYSRLDEMASKVEKFNGISVLGGKL